MRREQRTAEHAQRLKEEVAAKKRQLAQVEAQARAEARATQARRRQRVGTLADEAGLFVWQDATLAGLFQAVAMLREVPDPVAVLDGLLASPETLDPGVVYGSAHPPDGVGPCGANRDVAR